jgi:hypothetical protein
MIYVSGIHALNIPCQLETSGDWHASALKWKDVTFRDSSKSIFKDYGIESGHTIPKHNGTYHVANTIRALLDLIDEGNFAVAQGMNNDFICNPAYDNEVFHKVLMLKERDNWIDINAFMQKEYKLKWVRFLNEPKSNIQKNEIKVNPKIIKDFLHALTNASDSYILTGGIALWLCFGMNRIPDSIELLSSYRKTIQHIISKFCQDNHYDFTIEKDRHSILKLMIHYSHDYTPLNIEVLFINNRRLSSKIHIINGFRVLDINHMCKMKCNAYSSRDKLSDLFELTYIINNYFDKLDPNVLFTIQNALAYKNIDELYYLLEIQQDDSINKKKLEDHFKKALDKLDIIYEDE